jgi:hypothetical protein
MINIEPFINLIKREASRVVKSMVRNDEVGVFDSYDPKTHSVKVTLQPYGHKTGWIPLSNSHVGEGFGVAIGPVKNTQFLIGFRNGDKSVPYIKGMLFSDSQQPPQVESGEIKLQNTNGTNIFIDKDNNLTHTHSTGSSVKLAADGTATVTAQGATLLIKSGKIYCNGTGGKAVKLADDSVSSVLFG